MRRRPGSVRIDSTSYGMRRDTCIGIYANKKTSPLPVVASIDPSSVFGGPLDFEIAGTTTKRWPLCGPVDAQLGVEAVSAWRAVHDVVQWQTDLAASRAATERLLHRMKAEAAMKRADRMRRRAPR
jgi:hypothetical protein